ncbi:MAG: mismatch repair protein MutT [Naasia sp.]|uniref:NUDIX hydrolase n=1 Tax=Naasia sp. TaxID=2546198 RepID=UPI00262687E1|nr:NUDIX hydrolase [Naasia sp.]MCU1571762.1 mismatch repair protein MutT [Naasia sp.]
MTAADAGAVLAAGAVCWREGKKGVQVLVIHRGLREDVSFPKGKIDDGETIAEAAVREIREETGFAVTLGAPLGTTEYLLPNGRDKLVRYWAAEVDRDQLRRGRFRPSDEVDEIHWLSVEKARTLLTYERDTELLDRFQALVDRNHHRTFAAIVLRHAKAEIDSDEGDTARRLTSRGATQAGAIVGALAAFTPESVHSSPARRCLDTVKPLTKTLGLEIKTAAALSQAAWEGATGEDPRPALDRLVHKRIAKGRTAVFCTHSPVLPDLLDAIVAEAGGERDGRLTRAAILTTAEFTVVHIARSAQKPRVVAIESHAPLV